MGILKGWGGDCEGGGVGIVRGGGHMGKARAMDRASLPAWISRRLAAPSLTICMHVYHRQQGQGPSFFYSEITTDIPYV
jgi:hypothetical protein